MGASKQGAEARDLHNVREELEHDTAGLLTADRHVEEDLGPDGRRGGGVGRHSSELLTGVQARNARPRDQVSTSPRSIFASANRTGLKRIAETYRRMVTESRREGEREGVEAMDVEREQHLLRESSPKRPGRSRQRRQGRSKGAINAVSGHSGFQQVRPAGPPRTRTAVDNRRHELCRRSSLRFRRHRSSS